MKIILTSCVAALIALPVAAQEVEGCFMVDSSGRMLVLDGLCHANTANPGQATTQEERLSTLYARTYCDYRRSNRPHIESVYAAGDAIAPSLSLSGGNIDAIYAMGRTKILELCPELSGF